MKMLINKCRLFHLAAMILILISLGFALNSCEQDELAPTKPIDSSCDTTNVSYVLVIKPILENNCTTCHNTAYSGGNVNLEGYENVRTNSVNGRITKGLIGSMRSYISDECEIAKIMSWVDQGSKP